MTDGDAHYVTLYADGPLTPELDAFLQASAEEVMRARAEQSGRPIGPVTVYTDRVGDDGGVIRSFVASPVGA